jgi:hypothetical protein
MTTRSFIAPIAPGAAMIDWSMIVAVTGVSVMITEMASLAITAS